MARRLKLAGSMETIRSHIFKQTEILSREEEAALARQYRQTRDPACARRLIETHLRFVANIARKSCARRSMLPDVIQEGCIGLIRAVEKYDPDRGIRLSTYAAWWIRALIYQYLMANSRVLKVATTFHQRKLFFNLQRECARFESEGKEVDSKEIAARLRVPQKTVEEMRARLEAREVRFDTTIGVDADRFDSGSAEQRPDELVEGHQLDVAVRQRLETLTETLDARERAIFDERLQAEKPTTLREIGLRFGITREGARQVEQRLKRRLRPLFADLLESGAEATAVFPLAA